MKKKASVRGDEADRKLDSNERMTWIEEGGIDLRASREGTAKSPRGAKPSAGSRAKRKR